MTRYTKEKLKFFNLMKYLPIYNKCNKGMQTKFAIYGIKIALYNMLSVEQGDIMFKFDFVHCK